jgi:hypothetical protein
VLFVRIYIFCWRSFTDKYRVPSSFPIAKLSLRLHIEADVSQANKTTMSSTSSHEDAASISAVARTSRDALNEAVEDIKQHLGENRMMATDSFWNCCSRRETQCLSGSGLQLWTLLRLAQSILKKLVERQVAVGHWLKRFSVAS